MSDWIPFEWRPPTRESVQAGVDILVKAPSCPVCGAWRGPCRTRRGHARHDHRGRQREQSWVLEGVQFFRFEGGFEVDS